MRVHIVTQKSHTTITNSRELHIALIDKIKRRGEYNPTQPTLYEFDNFSVAGLELPGRVTLLGHPTVGVFVIYVGFPPLQL